MRPVGLESPREGGILGVDHVEHGVYLLRGSEQTIDTVETVVGGVRPVVRHFLTNDDEAGTRDRTDAGGMLDDAGHGLQEVLVPFGIDRHLVGIVSCQEIVRHVDVIAAIQRDAPPLDELRHEEATVPEGALSDVDGGFLMLVTEGLDQIMIVVLADGVGATVGECESVAVGMVIIAVIDGMGACTATILIRPVTDGLRTVGRVGFFLLAFDHLSIDYARVGNAAEREEPHRVVHGDEQCPYRDRPPWIAHVVASAHPKDHSSATHYGDPEGDLA